jgi:hypothetical protein
MRTGRRPIRDGASPAWNRAGAGDGRRLRDLYRQIYPPHLEVVAGIAAVSGAALDEVDMVEMEYGYFTRLWWGLLSYDRFVFVNDFGRYGDAGPTPGCSVGRSSPGRGASWPATSTAPRMNRTTWPPRR